MNNTSPQTALRAFLYGGAATLLAFELFFLARAVFTSNFVPVVPIVASVLTTAGLLLIIYAEYRSREHDKREHRRISRVAHQLESPLKALQGDLEALMANADHLPAEARLKLKHMETKTSVLLENIRDVFLTLQAQQSAVAQEIRTYDLCVLVAEAVASLSDVARARNVELISKIHCTDAPVRVDKRLMGIVLRHVIENAILYTMSPGMVNVAVMKGAKKARVVIQDRGIGISSDDENIIFLPFARGNRAEAHDPDGIGVGLTLSRLLVNEFKGTISWRNREQGMGSEVEIELPISK